MDGKKSFNKPKGPQNDKTYEWTNHAKMKMAYYGVPESRVKRIIRAPERVEEGVIEDGIAAMQTTGNAKKQEIWVMYVLKEKKVDISKKISNADFLFNKKICIITVWRYPGVSPKRDPIPDSVLREIRNIL
jgi:hypothetical protein